MFNWRIRDNFKKRCKAGCTRPQWEQADMTEWRHSEGDTYSSGCWVLWALQLSRGWGFLLGFAVWGCCYASCRVLWHQTLPGCSLPDFVLWAHETHEDFGGEGGTPGPKAEPRPGPGNCTSVGVITENSDDPIPHSWAAQPWFLLSFDSVHSASMWKWIFISTGLVCCWLSKLKRLVQKLHKSA